MNSVAWEVRCGGGHWAVKAVPDGAEAERFRRGLRFALDVEESGAAVACGAPVAAADGRRVVSAAGHEVALLRWVPGREPDHRSDADLKAAGATLGRVHRALGTEAVTPRQARLHLLGLLPAGADPAVLGLRPWIRPALRRVADDLEAMRAETLTWGPVHVDPAPEHFRLDDAAGACGLLDWGSADLGPRVFDLATVVMDVGAPQGEAAPLVDAYLAEGALSRAEAERALEVFLDFRYAVNMLYFADRILRGDATGLDDPAGNEERLEFARRRLQRPG
ncbi:hypothetical protein BIV57_00245 [Mangrovactinospora gilvigrisea]|uniref:Aminoglycoside phosphotransferase domain-containing protein n=2 Tax=Mangrovactinospora gilvigrisea TaxID=1428644 RepID=A0A1J7CCP6_9ACTN|nr:hypothetical protein BIV57_00245 [Mangrovactinospora gilvigrisea]